VPVQIIYDFFLSEYNMPYGGVLLILVKAESKTLNPDATMYWAFMEWAYYYNSPGLNITPESKEALRSSLSYVFFHWGLTPWSIYAIASLAMAYHFYINKSKGLNLSSLISSITGISNKGPMGKLST
jgi:choline-glycine betaine transporter